MDDQVKTAQNPIPATGPTQQPVATPAVQQPAQPMSTPGSKENGSILTIDTSEESKKTVQETAPEVKLPEEVKEAGVEAVKSEVLQVSPDLQGQGVQPVGIATPIPEEPNIKLPMTEEKAQGILKMHKKVRESVTWLAMLVLRQIQMMRFNKEKEEVTT